jgi:hemoglobin
MTTEMPRSGLTRSELPRPEITRPEITLYDRLGGADALRSVTASFYDKAMADDLLACFFAPLDLSRQARMLTAFLVLAFGGPGSYSGRDLRSAHAGLPGLTDEHFDRVVTQLAAALREAGAGDADIAAAVLVAESVRDDVLNR